MNICYMAPDVALPYFRGASTHVYEVSKNLSARGHRLWVISRRLSHSQPRLENIDGFETYRTFQGLAFEPPLSSYSSYHIDGDGVSPIQRLYSWYLGSFRAFQLGAEVATLMAGKRIDVVLERETAFGAGAVLSSILGVPMVLEMIGPRVSSMSLRRARKVLAYSAAMVKGRVPREKVKIVPAGVDSVMFSPDPKTGSRIRRDLGWENVFVVGYVGTFQLWHGVNTLLSACKRLICSSMRVRVLLVGPYYSDAKKYAKELEITDAVHFVGPVPYEQVPGYVNACDVLCAPYDPELSTVRRKGGIGAPLKLLEYMSCEKAVVSSRVPPIDEVIEDGRTGLLVRPGDPVLLAEALKELIGNPARAASMGTEARKNAVDRYSWSSLAQKLEQVLDETRTRQPRN